MPRVPRHITSLVLAVASLMPLSGQVLLPGATTRVSVATNGRQGDLDSGHAALSADGRFVAFESDATNLVPDDVNYYKDVFVRDRLTSVTARVSVGTGGEEANLGSSAPAISASGRYVAFESFATNLVSGDTNSATDVFVRDCTTNATNRVSVASNGTQAYGSSYTPAISADGRYVAFSSDANNLVPNDTNGWSDIFVHDRDAHHTTKVSVASDGTQGNQSSSWPAISADGRYVAFDSTASTLVANDTNGWSDIFVHDRETGQTTRVSVTSEGVQGNQASWHPAISANGRYVAFDSRATNLVPGDSNGTWDVFVHDRATGATTRVSVSTQGVQGYGRSTRPAISADGRVVAFESEADNLVAGGANGTSDIFEHDRATGTTTRVSVPGINSGSSSSSTLPAISADAVIVAFSSDSTNFVEGDTNDSVDLFVTVPPPGAPTALTAFATGATVTLSWTAPSIGGLPAEYVIEAGSAPGLSDLARLSTGNLQTACVARGVPYGEYFLRIRGISIAGTGDASNEVRVVVGPPGAPTSLSAVVSASTLNLSWTAPAAGGTPTSYVVEAGSASGLADIAKVSTGSTTTTFTATGVANGRYFMRVRSTNETGSSPPSNEVLVVIGPPAPGAPSGLTWSSAGSSISLTWTTPNTGGAPTSYTIEAGSSTGLANLANLTTGNTATSFASSGVGNGTYFVRVKASNTGGSSGSSNEVTLVVGCTAPPGAPTGLHTDTNSGGTIRFAWTAPSFTGTSNGPTTYVLEAGTAPGLSNLAVVDLGGAGTAVTFGGIGPGTYYVRVKSLNTCGVSAASNEFALVVQ
jgi:hypothetical protein